MLALAQFDAFLSRHPAASGHAQAPAAQPTVSQPALRTHLLLDPWGEPVAEFAHVPSASELLRAAHRLAEADCCVVLADDEAAARAGTSHPAWRLALLRRGAGLQWLSPALVARAGTAARALRADVQAAALGELWRQGWRVQA